MTYTTDACREPRRDVERPVPYFLLLADSAGAEEAQVVWRRLRRMGLTVSAEYFEGEQVGFEILACHQQAEELLRTDTFSLCTRGPVEGCGTGDPVSIFERWNVRFSERYAQQHRTHATDRAGSSARKLKKPTEIFDSTIATYAKALHEAALVDRPDFQRLRTVGLVPSPMFEHALEAQEPEDLCALRGTTTAPPEGGPLPLQGRVGICLFVVDIEDSGELRFADDEVRDIVRESIDGLSWLVKEHPTSELTFVYELHRVRIQPPNEIDSFDEWMRAALLEVDPVMRPNAPDGTAHAREYLADALVGRCTVKSIAIFITPYGRRGERRPLFNSGSVEIARYRNWYDHGQAQLDGMVAHEVLHAFAAKDEYNKVDCEEEASDAPSCLEVALLERGVALVDSRVLSTDSTDRPHGTFEVPNNNHVSHARPHQPCIMGYYPRRLCAYTRAHIGWTDLLVELETSRGHFSGTDSRVWLDIGDTQLELDIPERDDRWPGQRAAYGFYGIERVRRLMLRKEPGGSWDAWQLRRLRVWWGRDCELYDSGDLTPREPGQRAVWLDDLQTFWLAPRFEHDPTLVNSLSLELSSGRLHAGESLELKIGDLRRIVCQSFDSSRRAPEHHALDPGKGLAWSALETLSIRRIENGSPCPTSLKDLYVVANGRRFQLEGFDPKQLGPQPRSYRLIERPAASATA